MKRSGRKAKKAASAGGANTRYQQWIAEAIEQHRSPEHPYVSFAKIKRYLIDYLDAAVFRIPKMAKQALALLLAEKLIKAKKDSYAFTKAGEAKIAPAKVEKRSKVVRKEKVTVKQVKEEPSRGLVILGTGRVSRPSA